MYASNRYFAHNYFNGIWPSKLGVLFAQHGTYIINGAISISERVGPAVTGLYLLDGQEVTFSKGVAEARILDALEGSYLITGNDIILRRQDILAALEGAYALIGKPMSLTHQSILGASKGSYTITGQLANLSKQKRILTDRGIYSYSGQIATLKINHKLPIQSGNYSSIGYDVRFPKGLAFSLAQGNYDISGQPITMERSYSIALYAGTYQYIGFDAGLGYISITRPRVKTKYLFTPRMSAHGIESVPINANLITSPQFTVPPKSQPSLEIPIQGTVVSEAQRELIGHKRGRIKIGKRTTPTIEVKQVEKSEIEAILNK